METSKMKTTRKIIATAVVGLITVGMELNFSGCYKEGPLAPKTDDRVEQKQFNVLAFGDN